MELETSAPFQASTHNCYLKEPHRGHTSLKNQYGKQHRPSRVMHELLLPLRAPSVLHSLQASVQVLPQVNTHTTGVAHLLRKCHLPCSWALVLHHIVNAQGNSHPLAWI